MKKIKDILFAILIVLCVMFIVGAVGLVIPGYWITAIALIYCVYLIYRILNPKERFYFVTYWIPGGARGRTFVSSKKLIIFDLEKAIAKDVGCEKVLIDYYNLISKEEYESNKQP